MGEGREAGEVPGKSLCSDRGVLTESDLGQFQIRGWEGLFCWLSSSIAPHLCPCRKCWDWTGLLCPHPCMHVHGAHGRAVLLSSRMCHGRARSRRGFLCPLPTHGRPPHFALQSVIHPLGLLLESTEKGGCANPPFLGLRCHRFPTWWIVASLLGKLVFFLSPAGFLLNLIRKKEVPRGRGCGLLREAAEVSHATRSVANRRTKEQCVVARGLPPAMAGSLFAVLCL